MAVNGVAALETHWGLALRVSSRRYIIEPVQMEVPLWAEDSLEAE